MAYRLGLTWMVYDEGMSRIAKPSAVSPKMFRHFAVITLVVTVLVAMLADGEKRDAISQEIAARQAEAKAREASAANSNRGLKVRDKAFVAGFANDSPPIVDNSISGGANSTRTAPPRRKPLPKTFPQGGQEVYVPSGPYPGYIPRDADGSLVALFTARDPGAMTAEQAERLDAQSRQRSGAPDGE